MKDLTTNVKYPSGELVVLNAGEALLAQKEQVKLDEFQKAGMIKNAGGYRLDITTLTAISKSVTEQKFYTVAPADFIPVVVGEGAYSDEILKYTSALTGGDFSTGVLQTGGNNSRMAEVDASLNGVKQKIVNWGKVIGWSLFDLYQAAQSGNWDIVVSKEKSRKKNWDLGIQAVAFLGLDGDDAVRGLLNLPNVNSNLTVITTAIKDMTPTQFEAFLGGVIGAFQTNNNFTAMPNRFIIPTDDYNGLASAVDETYPLKSRLERILEAFRTITMNPDFKVLPLAYAMAGNNAGKAGLPAEGVNRYVLLNYDEDSIAMHIPLDYTNTMAGTVNNFQFQNVGYGQFTGVYAFRPLEVLYFDVPAVTPST